MIRFIIAFLILMMPLKIWAAQTSNWSCFKATSTYDGTWNIEQCEASVDIGSGKIKITMYKEADRFGSDTSENGGKVRFAAESINGEISANGHIRATEVINYTDADQEQLDGKYNERSQKQLWGKENMLAKYQTVILSNGYTIIGLSRKSVSEDKN